MKVIHELIDDIKERVGDASDYAMQVVMLQSNPNVPTEMKVIAKHAISAFEVERKNLILKVGKGSESLITSQLLKDLDQLPSKRMENEIKVKPKGEKAHHDIIGFGIVKELKKYILFLAV